MALADVREVRVVVRSADDSPNETGYAAGACEKHGAERGGPPPKSSIRYGIGNRVIDSTPAGPFRREFAHLLPPPATAFAGKCFSKSSKILLYSSAHEEGRTNP